jgi:hypothetical protein
MLKRAQNALTPDMRQELLRLAEHWERLAETTRHPEH